MTINRGLLFGLKLTYRLQLFIQWRLTPNPEWFDHYIDLFYLWGQKGLNSFWVERGVYSSMLINKNMNVLSLCCGDGFYAKHFYAAKAKNVLAVDFDPSAIAHAKKHHRAANVEFKVCDIRSQFPDQIFDLIIWNAAIEHFTATEIDQLLTKVKTQLKTNSVLSGYTIIENHDIKSHHLHEHEFHSKADLLKVLKPHFKHVLIFDTVFSDRHNLYFYASDGDLPFAKENPNFLYA